jgi:protein-S-isoprenylcysteine O-methyltransferase Ste14
MIAKWRVGLGFLAGVLFALMSHVGSLPRLVAGLAVAATGVALRGWAAGYLEKGRRLAQDGPYGIFRHPLYAGSFLLAVGLCLAGTGSDRWIHSVMLWGVFLLLFGVIYPRRIREEEAVLETHFGDAWRAFVRRNRRYGPVWPPFRRENPDVFSWGRYRRNREYNAGLGFAAAAALLVVKAVARG